AVKFYTVGVLFYVYGRAAENMVDSVLTIILLSVGILIGGVWFTVRMIKNRKKKRSETSVVQPPKDSIDVTAGEE
ncbi:hypothetical protein CKO38_18805, partial [Rhodospirillum rubrum]|nr:hypothetical protein [Rhodospirillum rubrum]